MDVAIVKCHIASPTICPIQHKTLDPLNKNFEILYIYANAMSFWWSSFVNDNYGSSKPYPQNNDLQDQEGELCQSLLVISQDLKGNNDKSQFFCGWIGFYFNPHKHESVKFHLQGI